MATTTEEGKASRSDSMRSSTDRVKIADNMKNSPLARKSTFADKKSEDQGDKKFKPILRRGKYRPADSEPIPSTHAKRKKHRVQFKEKLEEVNLVESYKLYNLEYEAQPSCACRIF
mmetsp:Transcript_71882/g.83550  ORF Transcript_71882/g.83550 Transcript_71882/m.83550 type:complete len:116 (+) Transcript_71882:19-366(+)